MLRVNRKINSKHINKNMRISRKNLIGIKNQYKDDKQSYADRQINNKDRINK